MLSLRSQPQMTAFHQERDRVFFGSDRVISGDLNDFYFFNFEFIAARSSFIRPDSSTHNKRRFLSKLIKNIEKREILILTENRSLYYSGSIANQQKTHFTAGSLVINPAADFNFLLIILTYIFYINPFHSGEIISDWTFNSMPSSLSFFLLALSFQAVFT